MEQPAEPVVPADVIERPLLAGHRLVGRRWFGERGLLGERAVRPVFVGVLRVGADDALEVAAAED